MRESKAMGGNLQMPAPEHPALKEHSEARAAGFQTRIADKITSFAGSMAFVYLHVVWFAVWIGFRLEKFPFGLLTMMVSPETIFLSMLRMIRQNRPDDEAQ